MLQQNLTLSNNIQLLPGLQKVDLYSRANFVTHLGAYPKPSISCIFGRGRHGIIAPYMSPATACTRQKLDIYQNLYLPSFWVLGWTLLSFSCSLVWSCGFIMAKKTWGKIIKASLYVSSCLYPFSQKDINVQSNHGSHALIIGKPSSAWIPK